MALPVLSNTLSGTMCACRDTPCKDVDATHCTTLDPLGLPWAAYMTLYGRAFVAANAPPQA
jgi:hypothetical protein